MPRRLANREPMQSCEIELLAWETEAFSVAGGAGGDDESAGLVVSDGFDAAFAELFSEGRFCRRDAPVFAFRRFALRGCASPAIELRI